jgi:hypothetical protein
MAIQKLETIPDDDLLEGLSKLLKRSRRVEVELIAHIGEVDARRLYAREGSSSMFTYCTDVLHLSEHQAYERITAARASRRFPQLVDMLEDGRLHLSGISKLVPHLTEKNCDEVLARAAHKTKKKIEELLAELAPRPDVPPVLRKLPERLAPSRPVAMPPPGNSCRQELTKPAAPAPAPPAPRPAVVEPLAPARFKVQFTASAALRDKLERLQALTGEDLAEAIEAAVTERVERLEARKYGSTKSPRKTLADTDTWPRSRNVPAAVRRAVRERDGDRCRFVSANGRRCNERRGLEFHHHDPYGRGGRHDPETLSLMCRAHNAHLGEKEYGKEVMERYRRPGDRVREPAESYGLLPAGSSPAYLAGAELVKIEANSRVG